MLLYNNFAPMGRRKKGYRAPEGLIKRSDSPNWFIKMGPIYKSTKTTDLTKATIILREVQKRLLERQDKAREILGESIPFSKLIARYLDEISPGKRSHKSDLTNSKYPLKYFGDRRIDNLAPKDIYKYQEWRKDQVSSRKGRAVVGATINREVALIRHALKKAVRWGYIDRNPAKSIEGLKETKRTRYITDEEFEAIKNVARSVREAQHLPCILDALYHTAQRSGRIFTLKWPQVDLKERRIRFGEGSDTKKVPDEIWVNQPLFEILSRLKAERSLQKIVGQYVFQKRDGTPYRSIKTTWNKCCRKAGVVNVHIHDIRHKAITDMGKRGYSLQEIAKIAGHSQISTTMRYTHLRAEDTREALESLRRK